MEPELHSLLSAGLPAMPRARINWGLHMKSAGGPYLVLNTIDLNEAMTYDGPDGLEMYRVQIDCYAPTYGGASDISAQVKDLLSGHREGRFLLIQFSSLRRLREDGDAVGESIFRASLDFMVHWRRTP